MMCIFLVNSCNIPSALNIIRTKVSFQLKIAIRPYKLLY